MATDGKEDEKYTSKRGYRVISCPYLSEDEVTNISIAEQQLFYA